MKCDIKVLELLDLLKFNIEWNTSKRLSVTESELLVSVLDVPKHETVAQWEERTGNILNNDAPVWVRAWKTNEDKPFYCSPIWKLWLYESAKIDPDNIIIVAIAGQGKPE